jgi:hypothetical protein
MQGSKFTFFPARTVRSDHVAAVAFRKIRFRFLPPFFLGSDYFESFEYFDEIKYFLES